MDVCNPKLLRGVGVSILRKYSTPQEGKYRGYCISGGVSGHGGGHVSTLLQMRGMLPLFVMCGSVTSSALLFGPPGCRAPKEKSEGNAPWKQCSRADMAAAPPVALLAGASETGGEGEVGGVGVPDGTEVMVGVTDGKGVGVPVGVPVTFGSGAKVARSVCSPWSSSRFTSRYVSTLPTETEKNRGD